MARENVMYNQGAETQLSGAVTFVGRADVRYSHSAPAVWAYAPRLRLSNVGTQREFSIMKKAKCHPDRPNSANGLCKPCYDKLRAELKQIGLPSVLCGCGCGGLTKPGNKYIHRHYTKSETYQRIVTARFLGKHRTDADKLKISEGHKGIHQTSEARDKIRQARLGHLLSDETKAKLSIALTGPNNPNWKGGKRLIPYDPLWTQINRAIRKRDNNICLRCGKAHGGRIRPDIHHIDANKRNSQDGNLICLCRSCHVTSENNIAVSMPILRDILSQRYGYQY